MAGVEPATSCARALWPLSYTGTARERYPIMFARSIACALFCAFPANAQTAVNWGGTGCTITIVTGQPHVAEITCKNVLTGGVTHNRGVLMLDGQPVEIIATMGPGDDPDRFDVIPPVGYTADPAVDVPEGGQAVIRVYPMLLG